MKNLGQLAELIQRRFEGGDIAPTAKYDYREILRHCQIALAELIKANAIVDFKQGYRGVDGSYIIAYKNQSVQIDSDRNEYYTTLPEAPIQLPNDMGVYQVSLMKNQQDSFIPMPNGFMGLFYSQDAACLENGIGFYIEDDKIFYVNGKKLHGKTVLIKLVASSEDSLINQGYEGQIIELVYKRLGIQVVEDIINDNTNNKDK